jgi:uncharacterized protein (DUF2147 family)
MMRMSSSRAIKRVAFLASLMVSVEPGLAESASDPSGNWTTDNNTTRIRIERCGERLEQICGYVVWMKSPLDGNGHPRKDALNPDPAKRSRLILGHQILMGLSANPDGHFGGQVYNAQTGKYYDITLWREGADRLKIRGCLMSVLCGSQTWTLNTNTFAGELAGATGDRNGPRADKEWVRVSQAKPATAAKAGQ